MTEYTSTALHAFPALICVIWLAGCAAPPTWEHPGLDPAAAERQGEIDSAECEALAIQSIALPRQPAQTEVNVNVDGYSSHSTMTGTEASAEIVRTRELMRASNARGALANACMLRRGWVKVRRGQQATFLPTSTAELQALPAAASVQPASPDAADAAQLPAPANKSPERYDEWHKSSGH